MRLILVTCNTQENKIIFHPHQHWSSDALIYFYIYDADANAQPPTSNLSRCNHDFCSAFFFLAEYWSLVDKFNSQFNPSNGIYSWMPNDFDGRCCGIIHWMTRNNVHDDHISPSRHAHAILRRRVTWTRPAWQHADCVNVQCTSPCNSNQCYAMTNFLSLPQGQRERS